MRARGRVWKATAAIAIACVMPATYLAFGGSAAKGAMDSAAVAEYEYGPPFCSFDNRTVSFALTDPGESAALGRVGDAIAINGTPCRTATVWDTDTIVVTGATGAQSLAVDLSGGPLGPGWSSENGIEDEYGTAEIEIGVDLGTGSDSVTIVGSSGADNIRAGSLGVNVNGDGDADISLAGVESLIVQGAGGNDALSAIGGLGTGAVYPAAVTLYGNAGDDSLYGGDGNDELFGGPGNDGFYELATPGGSDSFTGGAGTDTVSYQLRSSSVSVTSADGLANDGAAGEGDLVKADIEVVSGGSGDDSLTGGSASDTLIGKAGADTLSGGSGGDLLIGDAGVDTLYGGAGNDVINEGTAENGADTISGGAGVDRVSYASRSNAVAVSLQDGLAQDGESGEGDLVRVDVENVTGGSGHDTLVGSSSANVMDGGVGNDIIYAGDGNDTLTGGAGNDQLYGGGGNDTFDEGAESSGADTLVGSSGTDTVSYALRTNAVTVSLADGLASDGESGEGDLVRVDVENVTGGSGSDTLTGSSVANVLSGGEGDDASYAGAGDDVLTGGPGVDSLNGSDGIDTFHAQDGEADTLNGGAGNDVAADFDAGLDTLVSVP